MAKDIIRFHAVIWPTMLMALDLPLPKQVCAHGWIMLEGGKMSKSKGNVVDPVILIKKYGVDAVRYYLLRELSFGQDGYYSEEMLVNRINSDLANDLGNLISRTSAMIVRYFDGVIPEAGTTDRLDEELKTAALAACREATEKLDRHDFSNYLQAVFKLISRANKYIDETEPWVLARDDNKKARLATVMYNLAEAIRITLILTAPAMPTLVGRANQAMPIFADPEKLNWKDAGKWGLCQPGIKVNKMQALFPRIDLKAQEEEKMTEENKTPAEPVQAEVKEEKTEPQYITIDEFARMDLRVAEVIACEKMPKADKLLILKLKVGEEERTVVSGIAKHYAPEDLVGKKVVLVANLKPTKLRGTLSEGMILAASDENTVEVLTVNEVASGNRVK
jgi:methionyl-tRNA synthetase